MRCEADLIVTGANQVVTVAGNGKARCGAEMSDLGIISRGAVAINKGKIVWAGPESALKDAVILANNTRTVDAGGGAVLPGFVDPHTHMIFAGTREDEFADKIAGVPYMEIAAKGGGIKRTVKTTREASLETLIKIGKARLDHALKLGITCVEIKSGYGLDTETELKMLRAADAVRQSSEAEVVTTFLGAHEVPPGADKGEYLDTVCNEMIPRVAEESLASYCDVFCEKGVYTVEEARRVLTTGLEYGLRPKIHADQMTNFGGAVLAGELGAVSADHIDYTDTEGIDAMIQGSVIGVILPGAVFFLGLTRYPPVREMIQRGLPLALATDFNPGSCFSQNLHLMTTLACTQCRMTIPEAICAITLNAAYAVGKGDVCGSIEVGKRGDLVILDTPEFEMIPYHFGHSHIRQVICNGKIVD